MKHTYPDTVCFPKGYPPFEWETQIKKFFYSLFGKSIVSFINCFTGMQRLMAFAGLFLLGLVFPRILLAQTTVTYNATGSWVVPAGVTTVTVELWGGGGGGGYNAASQLGVGGGGGGAYTKKNSVTVTPGNTITVTVGTGGAGGSSSAASANGTASIFSTVTANGGIAASGLSGGNGGTAGATGDINSNGGNGGTATNNPDDGGGGGGAAGDNSGVGLPGASNSGGTGGAGGVGVSPAGNGGDGGSTNVSGTAGISPGGGGGGEGGDGANGGNGAAGRVLITYTCPLYSLTKTTIQKVCAGSASQVTLKNTTTADLPKGYYTITYDLTGANVGSGLTSTATVTTAGTLVFTTAVTLTNIGLTTITITSLESEGCISAISSSNTDATTIVAQPTGPTLSTPVTSVNNVCFGVGVKATFNSGLGGYTCSDDYIYFIDGILQLPPYISGNTVGATATTSIEIQGRRGNCTAVTGCNGTPYTTLASWTVNPLPQGSLTANSGPYCGTVAGMLTWTATTGVGPFTVVYNDGVSNRTASNVTSGTAFATFTTPVISTTTYTLVSVTDANGCIRTTGFTGGSATITIKPVPNVVAVPATQTICNAGSLTTIALSSSVAGTTVGSTFAWTRDNIAGITGSGGVTAFSGSGNISGSFTSTSSAQETIGFQVTPSYNGCTGTPFSLTVKVNPVATVNSIANQTVCNNTSTAAVAFSSSNATSYTWTNSQTAIGLAASGSGNIAAFTATNGGTAPLTGTINVTPVYTSGVSCNGTAGSFTITVNPNPILNSTLTPTAVCSGSVFNYTPTTSATGVTPTFSWTRATVAGISNAASSGTGDPNETLVNTTSTAKSVIYVYTVSASNNSVSCSSSTTYNVVVSVNPKPTVAINPSANQSICTGSSIIPVTITNPNGVAGVSFNWKRSNFSNVTGMANNGITNPITGTLSNGTGIVRATTFSVYTKINATGCTSDTAFFDVQVNPPITSNTILAAHVSEVSICGLTKQVTIATPAPTGGDGTYTYQWQLSSPGNNSFSDIPGATASTLVYYTGSNSFFRRIAYSGGCSNTSVEFHVNGPGAGTSSTTGACSGGSGMDISVLASYAGAVYTLEKSTNGGSTWASAGVSTITGTGATITFAGIITQALYRVSAVITGPGGCTQVIAGTVTIDANTLPKEPNISTSATPAIVCSGGSANLFGTYASAPSGSNPGFLWYNTGSGGISLNSTPVLAGVAYAVTPATPVLNPDTTISYYAKAVYTTTGCKSSSRDTVTITVNKTPVMTSTNTVAICTGSAVNLAFTNNVGASDITYNWVATSNASVGGESTSPVTNSTLSDVLTNNSGTTQTVTYTVIPTVTASTCTGSSQIVQVTVDPKPVIIAQTATVCSGTGFTISPANGGGNTVPTSPVTQYTWSAPSGSGFTGGAAGTGTSITGTLASSGIIAATATYNITPSGGACTGSAFAATITINPIPSITDQTVTVCNGTFSLPPFTGVTSIPVGTTYTWPAPTGTNISGMAPGTNQTIISGNLTNTSFPSVPKTATYTVTPNSPPAMASCPGSNFKVVATINPIPTATISGTTTVCQNSAVPSITFTGANGTAPYTFTYLIGAAGPFTITTSSGNSVNLPLASTANAGSFPYTLQSVKDNLGPACPYIQSGSATVTVSQVPVIPAQTVKSCSGTSFSVAPVDGVPTAATIVPTGTTYSWSAPVFPALPAGVTGATSGAAQTTFTQTLVNTTTSVQTVTYSVTPKASGCPGTAFPVTVTLDPSVPANTAIWTGASNTDWCNTANWACGIIPDFSKDAIIPGGTANQPSISGLCNATLKDLDLQGVTTLNLDAGRGLNIYGAFVTTTNPSRYTLNGTVNFAGGNQQIPGFTYSGLSVSGMGTITKTLSASAVVNGNLSLINGVIVTSNANMLTAGLTANVSSGSAQSYILGPLTRLTNSTGTYTFPVGGNGNLRNAYVIPQTNTASSYTVYYHNSAPTINAVLDINLGGVQKNEYWDIIRNSGADAVVGMDYKNPNALAAGAATTDWSGNFNPCAACNVAVAYGNASNNWYFTGPLGSPGFAPNQTTFWQSDNTVYSRQLLGNFGQFSFGYAYAIILPVKLISFTGNLQGNTALLEWKFANGKEVANTEIQYGTDGQHFNKLSLISDGNKDVYNYRHNNLRQGTHYYRLRISDKTGKTTFSNTVLLVMGGNRTIIVGIRPTLVHNETFVDIHSAKAQLVDAVLFDVAGRTVAQFRGSLQAGENSYRIPTILLATGLYTLQVKTTDGVMANLRFLKE